ncbi:MAG: glycoside hydrolase family 3 C-terminal domain-containing protein [Saprospiraceae bacterium]|nr:glycoside hydrolase family 3 C-terminal domain-containing protein [Saprospiraceae bacterium]
MKALRFIGYLIGGLLLAILLLYLGFEANYALKNSKAKRQLVEKSTLTQNGITFRDLNANGQLDVYEDARHPTHARVNDLLTQMTVAEKVGLMWHPPIGVGNQGEVLGKPNPMIFNMASSFDQIITKKLRTFNLFRIPDKTSLAKWHNDIQKLAEQDRLGIPISIASDPRHGVNNFMGNEMLSGDFSEWPEPIGLAATDDTILVEEFGRIAAQELKALGIRIALHPMADLATEPRWARINGTFGEDAELSAKMTSAYIRGFQGDSLDQNSVACMTKHWPGGGPQKDGEDAHFRYGKDQAYPGNNFDYHLIPFSAAFDAKTAMIMPYYGVPTGLSYDDVGMAFNDEIINGLLRKEHGYEGIVCSDWGVIQGFGFMGIELFEGPGWGVDDLSAKERIKKAVDAGIDQFGGNSNTSELIELVEEGSISELRIDESVRRILSAKFKMGLFEDPYVDEEAAASIVGSATHMEKGKIAQRKSIVLLKNHMAPDSSLTLPISNDVRIYVENMDPTAVSSYAKVVDSLADADLAILRIQTPWEHRDGNMMETFLHAGHLDFKEPELGRLLEIMKQKPTIVCIYLERPAVIPEITQHAVGILAEFGATDDAVLDIVFGKFDPTGKLPYELPSSMEAVEKQHEDVPYDSENPLFPFGFGLTYDHAEPVVMD